jgi:hypothetical protein
MGVGQLSADNAETAYFKITDDVEAMTEGEIERTACKAVHSS